MSTTMGGFFQLVPNPFWIPLVCRCLELSDVVALLPVVAKECTDRRCIQEATEHLAINKELRARIRGEVVLQLLMEVGRIEKNTARRIIGSMLEILSVVRIRSMSQSVTERLYALLFMVLSARDRCIPEDDRQQLLTYLVDEIGPHIDDRKAVLKAQCLYDGGLPRGTMSLRRMGPRGIKRCIHALW